MATEISSTSTKQKLGSTFKGGRSRMLRSSKSSCQRNNNNNNKCILIFPDHEQPKSSMPLVSCGSNYSVASSTSTKSRFSFTSSASRRSLLKKAKSLPKQLMKKTKAVASNIGSREKNQHNKASDKATNHTNKNVADVTKSEEQCDHGLDWLLEDEDNGSQRDNHKLTKNQPRCLATDNHMSKAQMATTHLDSFTVEESFVVVDEDGDNDVDTPSMIMTTATTTTCSMSFDDSHQRGDGSSSFVLDSPSPIHTNRCIINLQPDMMDHPQEENLKLQRRIWSNGEANLNSTEVTHQGTQGPLQTTPWIPSLVAEEQRAFRRRYGVTFDATYRHQETSNAHEISPQHEQFQQCTDAIDAHTVNQDDDDDTILMQNLANLAEKVAEDAISEPKQFYSSSVDQILELILGINPSLVDETSRHNNSNHLMEPTPLSKNHHCLAIHQNNIVLDNGLPMVMIFAPTVLVLQMLLTHWLCGI